MFRNSSGMTKGFLSLSVMGKSMLKRKLEFSGIMFKIISFSLAALAFVGLRMAQRPKVGRVSLFI